MKRTAHVLTTIALALALFWLSPAVSAQDILVTEADPAAAPQGTVNLDIRITGKGFKRGAAARFLRSGTTDPDGIQVNSTTYVSATELVANIDISSTASLDLFDIEVTVSGRKGKGTELFSVTAPTTSAAKPGTAVEVPLRVEFDDSPGMRIRSDGLGPYEDGVDGIAAKIDQYGNVIINFQTGRSPIRKVRYEYSDPIDATGIPPVDQSSVIDPPGSYMSSLHPNGPKFQEMAVGTWQCIEANIIYTMTDAKKTQYRNSYHRGYGSGIDVSSTAYLLADRSAEGVWVLQTSEACMSPDGEPAAAKLVETPTTGKLTLTDHGRYRMPLRITLTAK